MFTGPPCIVLTDKKRQVYLIYAPDAETADTTPKNNLR